MSESQVFARAVKIAAPTARAAYLDQACGGDGALRAGVEALLKAHETDPGFLEPAGASNWGTVDQPLPDIRAAGLVPADWPGSVLAGRYTLVEHIGEGGMGAVWLAQQTEPVRRLVAVKLLKAGLGHTSALARFEAERQALALMDHPNIARVFDAGATPEGRPFFVLELVRGVPLTRFCDEHQLGVRQRLELFLSVCAAIQHAHQKGVIHRDIKPSNVLVAVCDGQAVAKVIDFGVAKAVSAPLVEGAAHTGAGAIVGTIEYMSPEQASLNQLDVDTRSDVYALGVLLYELLTGTTPLARPELLEGGLLEGLRLIREQEPQRPSARLRDGGPLRGELDWIVMKALEKDRNRRYESASALAADVGRHLRDEAVQACPPSRWYRLGKLARRNKAATAVAVALLVAVVALAGGLVLVQRALKGEKYAKDEAQQARAAAVADAYRGLLGETRALQLARPAGWRATALDNLRRLAALDTPGRDLVELRSEAVACLAELDAREVMRLEGHAELLFGLDYSPDGQAITGAGYDGRVCVYGAADGGLRREVYDPKAPGTGQWGPNAPRPAVRFRPGGGYLAYTTWSHRVEVLGWGDRPLRLKPIPGPAPPRELAFDGKGTVLAITWASGQVGLYDAATGERRRMIDFHLKPMGFYLPVALSPAGDLVATRGPGEVVQVHAVAEDGPPRVFGPHGPWVRALAFSPDGALLASTSEDDTAKLWDVKTNKELLTLSGHTSSVVSVAFSPDGEVLATGSDDQTLRLWEVRTGRPLLVLRLGSPPQTIVFSPDGRRLACGNNTVVIHELTPRFVRRLLAQAHMVKALAFHPRKPLLASSTPFGTVGLREVSTGRAVWPRPGGKGEVGNLAFSPDGRLLAAAPFARFHSTFWLSGTISLVDSETGQERKRFAGDYSAAIAFDAPGRRLALGDQRGGVTLYDVASGELGPRRPVAGGWISEIAFVAEGAQVLLAEIGGVLRLVDLASGDTLRRKVLPRGLPRFAVSPSRRHVAAADLTGQVRILTLPELEVIATLEAPGDPRWIGLAFSPDGRWLALGGSDRRVTLYEARSFRRAFRLPPQNAAILELAFEPGGRRLAVGGVGELLSIWDMGQLEAGLAAAGLAADGPADGPIPSAPAPTWPRGQQVSLVPVEWVNWLAERVLETNPDQPDICIELAWARVMGPKKFRDPNKALPPARRAVELTPHDPLALNTLGVVYYRLGRWREAKEALQASGRANRDGPTAYDLFFLAMAHRQLGDAAEARACFERGERWWRARPSLPAYQAAELRAIRAEAAGLLRLSRKE